MLAFFLSSENSEISLIRGKISFIRGKKVDMQQVDFTSFLASKESLFGREAAKGARFTAVPYVLEALNEKKGLHKSIFNPFQLHNSA